VLKIASSSLLFASLIGLPGDCLSDILSKKALMGLTLDTSQLSDYRIKMICQNLPNLEWLSLKQCIQLQNPVFTLPNLRHLNLQGSALLETPVFLTPKLCCLDLSSCNFLAISSIILPNLEELQLTDSGTSLTVECPKLEKLKFGKLCKLTELRVIGEAIRKVFLSGCTNLALLTLDCPNLQKLNLDYCHLLTLSTVTQALKSVKSMQCLSVSKCQQLNSLENIFVLQQLHSNMEISGMANDKELQLESSPLTVFGF
jgi:hypothetical protein